MHGGKSLNLSSSENSQRHTAQSNGSFGPKISLYRNTGSASINAWSRPESCRWNSCCNCLCNASEPEIAVCCFWLEMDEEKEGNTYFILLSDKKCKDQMPWYYYLCQEINTYLSSIVKSHIHFLLPYSLALLTWISNCQSKYCYSYIPFVTYPSQSNATCDSRVMSVSNTSKRWSSLNIKGMQNGMSQVSRNNTSTW